MIDFGLYVIITNPRLGYGEIARICVEQGVGMLQLREKDLSDQQIIRAAAEIRQATRGSQTLFVMNDRADLALITGADVLHLGQDDLTIAEARRIVGSMPIALSTHSLEQARQALAQDPIYIGFGPVYTTTTKAITDPTVGTKLLSQAIDIAADVPVVAIGGIFPENLPHVIQAGARNYCCVRYLMQQSTCAEFTAAIKKLRQIASQNARNE